MYTTMQATATSRRVSFRRGVGNTTSGVAGEGGGARGLYDFAATISRSKKYEAKIVKTNSGGGGVYVHQLENNAKS